MNTYMGTFFILGCMYTFITLVALILHIPATCWISVPGMMLCYLGWRYSRDNLQ